MRIIQFDSTRHAEAVKKLNSRLKDANLNSALPVDPPPCDPKPPVWNELLIAADDSDVYGGYLCKHRMFALHGKPEAIDNLHMPLSLGLIDTRYAHLSASLIFDAFGRNPSFYSVGVGTMQAQAANVLTSVGCRRYGVPLRYAIKSGNVFARNIKIPQKKKRWLQLPLRIAGYLRIASAIMYVRRLIRKRKKTAFYDSYWLVPEFDRSVDVLYKQNRRYFSLAGDRSSGALNCLYNRKDARYLRLMVERDGRVIGWAILLDLQMRKHKYFGNMRIGVIADCFASKGDEAAVIAAADRFLNRRGDDLIISYQMDSSWLTAFDKCGFSAGPTDFFLFISPQLLQKLRAQYGWETRMHINLGDSDSLN